MRLLLHRLTAEESRYLCFFPGSQRFVKTVQGTITLKNRAREIRDELAQDMASVLALSVGRDSGEDDAQLAASLLLATWTTAFIQAHQCYSRTASAAQAKAAFLMPERHAQSGFDRTRRFSQFIRAAASPR